MLDDVARSRHGTAINSPFRLLGQIADDDAELCFTRYRCFDPEIGSWISSDPLEVAGGLNLYGFDGAPTDVVDPLGLAVDKKPHSAGQEDPALCNGWKPDPKKDLDWRGTGKDHRDALDEAFRRTGVPREEFEVTRWGRTKVRQKPTG
ncbi:MAG: polymorphic toxin type 47 domain-containing protein [Polyangiaceae bacterium]